MWKVLIADDEQPVIDGLQFLIGRHFEDLTVCAAARNGREAMEMVRLHQPDIVLMDVRMPGLSGLDAIRELRMAFPQMVFILVTAYERFEIAKEAIDLGIQDYLLKPVGREALIQVLNKAKETVRDRQNLQRREIGHRDWREDAAFFLEQALLFSAASNAPDWERESLLKLLHMDSPYAAVVTVEWEAEDMQEAYQSFLKFRESLKFKQDCAFGAWNAGRFSLFFPLAAQERPWNRQPPLDFPEGLRWKAGEGPVLEVYRMRTSQEDSFRALESAGWGEWKTSGEGSPRPKDDYPYGLQKALLRALAAGDFDQVSFILGPFWAALETAYNGEQLRSAALRLVTVAAHQQAMETVPAEPLEAYLAPLEALSAQTPSVEIRESVRQVLARLARRVTSDVNLSPIVEKTVQFLKKSYASPLSLEDAAREVGVHPQYLSRIFSQEKGESFVDYLTRLRMSRARDLLKEGLSVKETSSQLGYADANYFSRLFKKWEGVNPGDFAQGKR